MEQLNNAIENLNFVLDDHINGLREALYNNKILVANDILTDIEKCYLKSVLEYLKECKKKLGFKKNQFFSLEVPI